VEGTFAVQERIYRAISAAPALPGKENVMANSVELLDASDPINLKVHFS
jgi:hypothetical protein